MGNFKVYFCARFISFLWRNNKCSYLTQRMIMTWGCVIILTQGLFKVIGRNNSYFVFLWRNIRSSYLNKDCMRFENMSWSWPKIICARSRSLSKDVNTLTRLYMYIELENDMNENLTQRLSGTELRPELELLQVQGH